MTTPDRWYRIKQMLERALAIAGADRPAFLDQQCAGDVALRAEVESLLTYDTPDDAFLEQPAFDFLGADRHESWLGRRLGHFTVTKKLATGGMGQVYLAEQQVPLRRTVAIKRIRPGMSTDRFLARFDLERQALALMNHPNVAQVYDAGTTDRGEPYVVMEYVDGEPVTRYCRAGALTIRDRLGLFAQVCQGVEHAHQKGIIHGDLKPANVLVTAPGVAGPTPKVIDFGVARLVAGDREKEQADPDAPPATLWFGSPPYASPEQLAGDSDIDTRSDVYALGVLLYELLAGVPPVDGEELSAASPGERRRLLLESQPDPPSARAAAVRQDPHSAPAIGRLGGDLDRITLKAMARDRGQRYATVGELRADLDRYAEHKPVLATPPTRRYRFGRFIRRHAVGVAAGAAVIAALVTATVTASLGLVRAVEAEHTARQEAEKTRQVSEFLVDIFRVTDPREARGRDLSAREVVDHGVRRLRTGLAAAPEIEAALLDTIGTVYMQLGLFDEARPLLEKGLALRTRQPGAAPGDHADSLRSLGLLEYYSGNFAESEALHRQALAENTAAFGGDHPRLAVNLHNIGSAVDQQGRWAEAEGIMREALALRRRAVGGDDEQVALTLNNLAGVLRRQGKPAQAAALYEQSLTVRRAIGHGVHPDTATVLSNLGVVRLEQGLLDDAARLHNEALAMQRDVLGETHPAALSTLTNLASVLVRQGRYDEAEPLLRQSVALHKQAWGPTHINTAQTLNSLAAALHQHGRYRESLQILGETAAAFDASVGPDHPLAALAQVNTANALVALDQAAEAEAIAADAAARLARAGLPADHALVALAESVLGASLAGQGRYQQAETLMVGSLAIVESRFGPDSARAVELKDRIARMYLAWGRPERAQAYSRDSTRP